MPETQNPIPSLSRADVCLVNMPYASLNRPSLALGLLKAVLEREGIATKVLYPNLTFAETIGLRLYHLCSSQLPKDFLVGEWTFAEAAFRDAPRASDEEYLARIAAHRDTAGAARLVEDLRTVRRLSLIPI
jgi:hypothetical protein